MGNQGLAGSSKGTAVAFATPSVPVSGRQGHSNVASDLFELVVYFRVHKTWEEEAEVSSTLAVCALHSRFGLAVATGDRPMKSAWWQCPEDLMGVSLIGFSLKWLTFINQS